MPSNSSTDFVNATSASSFLTYPVRYAVSGVFRRLSIDPGSYIQNEDVRPCETMSNLNLSPPSRQPTPFQPPPLTPLTLLSGPRISSESAPILSKPLAEEIRLLIPSRLQLADSWKMLFNLEDDGSSLATLYDRCDVHKGTRNGFILVIRDGLGSIFGAYLNEPLYPSGGHYYGNGECFLWRASTLPAIPTIMSLPPTPSSDTTNLQRMTTIASSNIPENYSTTLLRPHGATNSRSGISTPERIRFKAFPYSGINDYMIFCEPSFVSVGGGDGHYGLWLDDSLEKGISSSCLTFGNEPLSDEGTKFEIIGIELWKIGD